MLHQEKPIYNMEFFTIGVYNSTENEFFNKLTQNNIDTFCDIRQRRGVRGAKYSFVNSNRLQEKLNDLDEYLSPACLHLNLIPPRQFFTLISPLGAFNV